MRWMGSGKEGVASEEKGVRRESPEEYLFVKDNTVTQKLQPTGRRNTRGGESAVNTA